MIKQLAISALTLLFMSTTSPAHAAETFPRSGAFIEREQFSESELDFKKHYLGFPDEVCSFKSPKRLKPNLWRITTTCRTSEDRKPKTETATLEKRGKKWRLTRGEFIMNFEK